MYMAVPPFPHIPCLVAAVSTGTPRSCESDEHLKPCPLVQHILYKSVKIWSGDCGVSGGTDSVLKVDTFNPNLGGSGDAKYPKMPLTSLKATTISSTIACFVYTAKNDSPKVCLKWGLDAKVNPKMFKEMKQSTTATHELRDDERGVPSLPPFRATLV
jgi:hypothetical protein